MWQGYIRHMATAFSLDRFARSDSQARAEAVVRGIPAGAIRQLVSEAGATVSDLAKIVAPRRTLDRRLKENARLTLQESDRLARLLRVLDLAARIFGDRRRAMAWMTKPKERLNGETPLDRLRTEAGAREIEEWLEQSRHGFNA